MGARNARVSKANESSYPQIHSGAEDKEGVKLLSTVTVLRWKQANAEAETLGEGQGTYNGQVVSAGLCEEVTFLPQLRDVRRRQCPGQ